MLHHKFIGKGRTVVFLHGFLESLTMWEQFPMEDFGFQCLLIDLPGHGKSLFESEEHTIKALADSVQQTLKDLGVFEFDIIGHSLGGYVAIQLHEQLNSKGKLCLFHSNFWEDDEQKKNDRNRVINIVETNKTLFIKEAIPNLFIKREEHAPFIECLIEEAMEIDSEAIVFHSKAMRDRSSKETYVCSLKDQFRVIQGEEDKIVPTQKMIEYRDQVSISLISNAGHMGHVENTEQCFKEIQSFFY